MLNCKERVVNVNNKHYIRVNENNLITHGFSDAFETPTESDICIKQDGGRHFELCGVQNPTLTKFGLFVYKYVDKKVARRTDIEISAEQLLPIKIETPIEEILAREIIKLQNELWELKNNTSV